MTFFTFASVNPSFRSSAFTARARRSDKFRFSLCDLDASACPITHTKGLAYPVALIAACTMISAAGKLQSCAIPIKQHHEPLWKRR